MSGLARMLRMLQRPVNISPERRAEWARNAALSRDNRMMEARRRKRLADRNPEKYGTEADMRAIRTCVVDARKCNRRSLGMSPKLRRDGRY